MYICISRTHHTTRRRESHSAREHDQDRIRSRREGRKGFTSKLLCQLYLGGGGVEGLEKVEWRLPFRSQRRSGDKNHATRSAHNNFSEDFLEDLKVL